MDLPEERIIRNDDIKKELKHWGILGMHWGVRRFQNEDGTLTEEGRIRYGVKTAAETRKRSYSKKYETLKQKGKNRTVKEEKYFKILEKGKKYVENRVLDPSKNEPFNLFSKEFWAERIAAQRYIEKTNYGEQAEGITELLGWPVGLLINLISERPAFESEIRENAKKRK